MAVDMEIQQLPASAFIRSLPARITYAVERNIDSFNIPLKGDIDILITSESYLEFLKAAHAAGILLFCTPSFGGARLFLGTCPGDIKRVDCGWHQNYKGIPLGDVGELLKTRVFDQESGIYLLPPPMQAKLLWMVKNAYGGAEKYRELLTENGFNILTRKQRRIWLVKTLLANPLKSLFGFFQFLWVYVRRLSHSSGLLVYGISVDQLWQCPTIQYLFQGRIGKAANLISGILRSRINSEALTVGNPGAADIDLSICEDNLQREIRIMDFLRIHRID